MSRNSTLFSPDLTSRLSWDWLTQPLPREESPQYSMRWSNKNFFRATFSLSTWLPSRTKRNTVSSQIWPSVTLTRQNSMVTFTGMTSTSNTCSVSSSTISKLTESRCKFARRSHRAAWSPSTQEPPSCRFQPLLSTQWLNKRCQLLTLSSSARTKHNSVISPLSLVERIIALLQMSGCSIHNNWTWPRVDRRWNSKWDHWVHRSLLKLSQRT